MTSIEFMKLKKNESLLKNSITFLFVLLFLYASLSKLMDYDHFLITLAKSPIAGRYTNVVGLGIPVIEIIIAMLLLIPRTALAGYYASFLLMFAFTLYVGLILGFSKRIPCSCGGILQSMSWKGHLFFNCFFLLLAAYGVKLFSNVSNVNSA